MPISPRTKLLYLMISIILLPLLAYAGWKYGAARLETFVQKQINLANRNDTTLTCNQLNIRGFPFRIGFHCDNIAFDHSMRRIGVSAGALRTAAQIYDPGHIIAELDGPMRITGKNFAANITWDIIKASAHLNLQTISRFSSEASNLSLNISVPTLSQDQGSIPKQIYADKLEAHARKVDNDLDVAGGMIGLRILDETGQNLTPSLQTELYVTIKDQAKALNYANPEQNLTLKGSELEIKTFRLSAQSGAQIGIEGPVSFTQSGLMNGTLSVNIANLDDLIALIAFYQPQFKDQAEQARPYLSAFQSSSADGTINLRLTIQNGLVSAGFFPLVRIPAI